LLAEIALDRQFQLALRDALLAAVDNWLPGEPPPKSAFDALAVARGDFGDTLHIPDNITVETNLDGRILVWRPPRSARAMRT
jgi:hypothetical protein